MKRIPFYVAALWLGMAASAASALPSLQLGPGSGSWSYDAVSETWQGSGGSLELAAYANAERAHGGSGAYAWPAGSGDRIAYLVLSGLPAGASAGPGAFFDVSVVNDGVLLAQVASGYGAPPLSDPNGLPLHEAFPAYFEIYAFRFDGPRGLIGDTEPGASCTGRCQGYTERFAITVSALGAGLAGVHVDLFTSTEEGLVYRYAPFSHDAEIFGTVGGVGSVPEPSAGGLVLGALGLLFAHRRMRAR